ncbi:MAG: aminoacyl-histidine dipeptidase [Fuerstiella sp.]
MSSGKSTSVSRQLHGTERWACRTTFGSLRAELNSAEGTIVASDAFQNIEPALLWQHFDALVKVPRPSKQEAPAIDHLVEWAEQHSFSWQKDAAGNLAVHVPATAGSDQTPTVILQSHVDIVVSNAEDAPDGVDAAVGKIPVVRAHCDHGGTCTEAADGDWLWAPYTTLGADNGLGVVSAMAAAEETEHGPLILLFTVDEEEGLTGARKLDPSLLDGGQYLINLDSEDDDVFTIGCAGGLDTEIQWTSERTSLDGGWVTFRLKVDGCKGGHSGVEIDQARANANRLLARWLDLLSAESAVRIHRITGGDRRNAIPRSAECIVSIPADAESSIQQLTDRLQSELKPHFAGRDEGINLQAQSSDEAEPAYSTEASSRLIKLLLGLPDGVAGVCPEVSDLVETSNNMALVSTSGDTVSIVCSSRSSSPFALQEMGRRVQIIAELAGGSAKATNGYPGWKPRFDSPLTALCVDVYESVFGQKPTVESIHAGLECGAILANKPELDAASVGPTIRGNHAPGERVSISSVQKFYQFLAATLQKIAAG